VSYAHAAHDHADRIGILLIGVVVVLLCGYLILAVRIIATCARPSPGWNLWRLASFLGGGLLLLGALAPPVDDAADHDFGVHMAQHLLIGMVAPLGLVLGAPLTLLLRSLPVRYRGQIGQFLHHGVVRALGYPVTALVLNIGGLLALYFTPLYSATTGNPALHHLVHLHFLLSGYLFAWVIAGPDPAPRRPSVPARKVILGIAIAAHSTISQLMYAGAGAVEVPVAELQNAAQTMYYGGDLAELLLALALVTNWRPRPSTEDARAGRPMSTTEQEPLDSVPRSRRAS